MCEFPKGVKNRVVSGYVPGGNAVTGAILNSFIHVIKYSYNFLSTFGPKYGKSELGNRLRRTQRSFCSEKITSQAGAER